MDGDNGIVVFLTLRPLFFPPLFGRKKATRHITQEEPHTNVPLNPKFIYVVYTAQFVSKLSSLPNTRSLSQSGKKKKDNRHGPTNTHTHQGPKQAFALSRPFFPFSNYLS